MSDGRVAAMRITAIKTTIYVSWQTGGGRKKREIRARDLYDVQQH